MSYVVLARKYRPPNFESLVGQEHVVQALANALTQQRLHHAYLFTGTRGVGKTTISRILAKSLNCTGTDGRGSITAQPCGACDACRDIDAGRFIDYVELDAASNRGVDEISQLLDQAVYKPVLGRFKVYMIDEVHMLTNHAFNAMLKTLEEPPEYLKFVLATTDPQKVPPTVLSRCLQFNLRPMPAQIVQKHLADVLAQEHIQADPGALRLLARAARGSMRDGLSLTDQAIAFGAGVLAEDGVRQMLGAVDRGHAVRILDSLASSDGAALVKSADTLRDLGLSAAGTLEEMCSLLQQMAVVQVVAQALDPQDPDAAETARLAGLIAADEVQLLYSIALHGREELGLAPDEYSALVMVLLRMLAFRPQNEHPKSQGLMSAPAGSARTASSATAAALAPAPAVAHPQPGVVPASPLVRPSQAIKEPPAWLDVPFEGEESQSNSTPSSRQEVAQTSSRQAFTAGPPAASTKAVYTPGALGERWAEIVRELIDAGLISAFARELALQSQCTTWDEEAAVINCRLRVEREVLRADAPREKLQAALAEKYGREVRIEVESGPALDSPAMRETAERERRQAQAEQIIHDDPLVQALMAQYKTARIVPGSVKPH